VLEFIKTLSKEAAIKYCAPKNVNSDTLMDNADFYEKHPEIFKLNNQVKKDNEAFYHFLKKEQCLFFALPQDQHELIEQIDDETLTGLIRQQSLLIDAAQNYIELRRKQQVDQNCVIGVEALLTKGWGEENASISAIYDETDGFNETFYRRTREEIIDPKIQKKLDTYERLKFYRPSQAGGRKSKKQKNNPKRRQPKLRVTKRRVMTKPNTSSRNRINTRIVTRTLKK
jgi:hypothetical protein